jgi:hypothetical protein
VKLAVGSLHFTGPGAHQCQVLKATLALKNPTTEATPPSAIQQSPSTRSDCKQQDGVAYGQYSILLPRPYCVHIPLLPPIALVRESFDSLLQLNSFGYAPRSAAMYHISCVILPDTLRRCTDCRTFAGPVTTQIPSSYKAGRPRDTNA